MFADPFTASPCHFNASAQVVSPSESSKVLVGALGPPGEFKCLLTDCWPILHANPSISSAFRYIPSTAMWLRPFVLTIASLQFSPLKPFDFSLFNCSLVNFSHGVKSPVIEGIGAQSRLSPIHIVGTVLPSLGLVRWEGWSG